MRKLVYRLGLLFVVLISSATISLAVAASKNNSSNVKSFAHIGLTYKCLPKGSQDFNKWDSNGHWSPSCWAGAQKVCDDIGMRLPDIATLENLYNNKESYPNLPKSDWYWTSSNSSEYSAYIFNFTNGWNATSGKKAVFKVLCVGK